MKGTKSLALILFFLISPAFAAQHGNHDTGMRNGAHAGMEEMKGMLGGYSMSRESSGTSWQPDSSPTEGLHFRKGEWMLGVHGRAAGVYSYQEGPRGDDKLFSTSMFMLMAARDLGRASLGFRGMLSLEPLTLGKRGYPLLLQSGETADGKIPLIDRQHPHDLFMELAGICSLPVSPGSSLFIYAGMPGEPALGPPAYLHRFSGMDMPEAPLSHHWLDSTHITFGVATLGYIHRKAKLEFSVFTGREPDENRWNFDSPEFDSYSGRFSFNPGPNWALQASFGRIRGPEQLHPEKDTDRATASAIYNLPLGSGNWQTTFAWGRNDTRPGNTLDALLLESALRVHGRHTFFGRAERVEKDELFFDDPREDIVYTVEKLSLGYVYDFPEWKNIRFGVGGSIGINFLPEELEKVYGRRPLGYFIFTRAKL